LERCDGRVSWERAVLVRKLVKVAVSERAVGGDAILRLKLKEMLKQAKRLSRGCGQRRRERLRRPAAPHSHETLDPRIDLAEAVRRRTSHQVDDQLELGLKVVAREEGLAH
jgi:hypothetical protein